jgi:hypothetical protein
VQTSQLETTQKHTTSKKHPKKVFSIDQLAQHLTMATIVLIKEAIVSLKDRTGSSVSAINKFIESEKKVGSILVANGIFPSTEFCVRTCCVWDILTPLAPETMAQNSAPRSSF